MKWFFIALLLMGGVAQAQPIGGGTATSISPSVSLSANPVTATGGNTAITEANRAAFTVNVKDFGAVGDNTTDDTVAINAAITYWKSLASGSLTLPGATLMFQKGAGYKITGPLNFTGLTHGPVYVEGNGAVINCVVSGGACIDALSSRWVNWKDLTIWGDASTTPAVGMQIGRVSSSVSADNQTLTNVFVWGSFSLAPIYNYGSESTLFSNVRVSNVFNSAGPIMVPGSYGASAVYGTAGHVAANVADSATAGGNARGANSVDWQNVRGAASQVASGTQTTIVGGNSNTASGATSVVGGTSNSASNTSEVVIDLIWGRFIFRANLIMVVPQFSCVSYINGK